MSDSNGNRSVYVSIDTETTGLDPNWCQILEIGAVIDDCQGDLIDKPQFHCYVLHNSIMGQPYALAMNADILRILANAHKEPPTSALFLKPDEVGPAFEAWLVNNLPDPDDPVTPAGKNFGSFDRQFLEKFYRWPAKKLRHRAIDPGNLCWHGTQDDKGFELPGSDECMRRCEIDGQTRHRALDDALDVCRMVRYQAQPDPWLAA